MVEKHRCCQVEETGDLTVWYALCSLGIHTSTEKARNFEGHFDYPFTIEIVGLLVGFFWRVIVLF